MKNINKNSEFNQILNSTNPGACGSRNLGIKSAKGDIIALLDDDDTFEVNKIERMITYFENNVGLVYCNINQIQNGKNIKSKKLNFYENDAFEKLLDSLFEDVAWDISSDISVMKTMMAQDGLTRHGAMNTGTVQEDTEE